MPVSLLLLTVMVFWHCSAFAGESLVIDSGERGQQTFQIELAVTPETQMTGLMHRRTLDKNHGMLFVYPAPQLAYMWMRNTYLPLDMLFIAQDGVIRHIEKNAVPHSEKILSSGTPVLATLEISGGLTDELNIQTGDRVIHRVFAP